MLIKIVGSAASIDTLAIHDREDPLWLKAGEISAKKGICTQAGLGPEDIDLFELHDAFSVMAALSLEVCGFAERGQGVRAAQEWRNIAKRPYSGVHDGGIEGPRSSRWRNRFVSTGRSNHAITGASR